MLVTTLGAFAAFSLMTIAVGTDYWLYSRGVCRTKSTNDNDTSRKNEEVMTHSGLWRTCCLEGIWTPHPHPAFRGAAQDLPPAPQPPHRRSPSRWSSGTEVGVARTEPGESLPPCVRKGRPCASPGLLP